jgi:hypothetical protein
VRDCVPFKKTEMVFLCLLEQSILCTGVILGGARTCGLVLCYRVSCGVHISKCLVEKRELTLRPAHLILDPGISVSICIPRLISDCYNSNTYSLILSVMFTMLPFQEPRGLECRFLCDFRCGQRCERASKGVNKDLIRRNERNSTKQSASSRICLILSAESPQLQIRRNAKAYQWLM